MKIKAKFGVMVGDHIYHRGETMEVQEDGVTARIARCFVMMDGSPLAKTTAEASAEPAAKTQAEDAQAKIAKTVDVMGRNGIVQQLDAMGITYSPNAKTAYLAKLLLVNKGEITVEE